MFVRLPQRVSLGADRCPAGFIFEQVKEGTQAGSAGRSSRLVLNVGNIKNISSRLDFSENAISKYLLVLCSNMSVALQFAGSRVRALQAIQTREILKLPY